MPRQITVASQLYLQRNDNPVPHHVMVQLVEATVEQHAYLPHMVTLRFQDPQLALLDGDTFNLGDKIAVSAKTSEGKTVSLFEGEITALEPEFARGMLATFVVRGYDRTHRLYRQVKSCAFVNQKDSDIARKIAQEVGLKAEVDDTRLVYDHVFQDNQSDLAFLLERAWRIGFECFVEGDKLLFRKPRADEKSKRVTLEWGEDLVAFYPRLTLAEQVDEVVVKGWDEREQKAIVGRAENGRLYPQTQSYKNGAEAARQAFGRGKKVIVNQPVVSQAEANILAQARLDEVSGAFFQAEGEAFRRPHSADRPVA
ncbi:MAG: phage late control D family protein, partial [Anaerolineales bacterium]|nr:phage late control D family protein [Anaerolineales bacterium]